MRNASILDVWRPSLQKQHPTAGRKETRLAELLEPAGIAINGNRPWDIQVRDQRFYSRLFAEGTLGLGESYVDGWWDVEALDEFFARTRRARLDKRAYEWGMTWLALESRLMNLQTYLRSRTVAAEHYDLGNDLYEAMLDPLMQYSCAYWATSANLADAQRAKLDLVCRKLQLTPGMRVLDLGGGFGGFAHFAARNYGCEVVSYNISEEQVAYGRELCRDLPVRFELKDYRDAVQEPQPFDRIAAIGLCEHIGYKNYRQFFETAYARLSPGGLFLVHSIGGNESYTYADPWIDKYIFPHGLIPSIAQLGKAMEGLWVVEDWHNFGPDYDPTLMAWWRNFDAAWPSLRPGYGDRFYRMWKYYLQSCAGSFRARALQLWQIVVSKGDVPAYTSVR